jgi:tight adherence protein B
MSEWLAVTSLLMIVGGLAAGAAHLVARSVTRAAHIAARFREATEGPVLPGRSVHGGVDLPGLRVVRDRMWQAGIPPAAWHAPAAAGALAAAVCAGWLRAGPFGGLVLASALAAAIWALLIVRFRRRQQRVLELLPAFLEHVVRAVQAGASVPAALKVATGSVESPLAEIFERVNRQVDHGANLEDAMSDPQVTMGLRELRVLALTITVNQQFGGSIRDLLCSVVGTVRMREHMRREFRAMTGETRLSAWILGTLPALIMVYVVAVNPGYVDQMRQDPAGQWLLAGGLTLEVFGSLVLWRMVRSV